MDRDELVASMEPTKVVENRADEMVHALLEHAKALVRQGDTDGWCEQYFGRNDIDFSAAEIAIKNLELKGYKARKVSTGFLFRGTVGIVLEWK